MEKNLQPAIAPEILHTGLFQQRFATCLGRRPQQLTVVVPYIGKTPWGTITHFSQVMIRGGCEFRLATSPPSTVADASKLSTADAATLVQWGVKLRIRRHAVLHSKIYQFLYDSGEMAAFVGSANFSMGGFKTNDETVAFFQAKADNQKVAKEIQRLWSASVEYSRYQLTRN